jgi:hypothetical protein
LILTNAFARAPGSEGEGIECSSAGNWNQVLFDGGSGAGDYQDQIVDGAEEDVSTGDVLDSFTGTGGLRSSDLNQLVNTEFWLPVFETTNGQPGTNLEYFVSGFVEVRLNSWSTAGPATVFNITPLRYLGEGTTCCLVNAFNAEYQLCDVGTIVGEPSPSADCSLRTIADPTQDPPDAEPPPAGGSDCEPAATAQQMTSPSRSGNTLSGALEFEVAVVDPADCDGLDMRVERVSNGAILDPSDCCSLDGLTYSSTFPASRPGWQWNGTNYELIVFIGDEDLASYPFTVP